MPILSTCLNALAIRSHAATAVVLALAAGTALSHPVHLSAQGLGALRVYEGTWQVKIERLSTPHSAAGTETTTLRNECWESGVYFACHQFVNGKSAAMLVFTYDSTKDIYTSYPIPADGTGAGKGTLIIRGNEWTFPWTETEGTTSTYYRVVNVFVSNAKIEYRKECSSDQLHWTVLERGEETRATTPYVRYP